jgi:hypothetical protein
MRNGIETPLYDVPVTQLGSDDTTRLVQWAGMLLEPTYPAITISTGFLPEEVRSGTGVYCSRWNYGSPCHMYGLRASAWIVSVNDISTPDLETFLKVVNNFKSTRKSKIITDHSDGARGEDARGEDARGEDARGEDARGEDARVDGTIKEDTKGEEAFVRIMTIGLTGQKKVYTLQPDPVYWPSIDLKRQTDGVWHLER